MASSKSEKLFQLNTIVLTDPPMPKEMPIYLFTETPDNQDPVLMKGRDVLRWNFTFCKGTHPDPILIIDNQGGSNPGYPGASVWRKELHELEVQDDSIMLIPFNDPVLHTLSEAFAVVRFVQEKGWKDLIIIAPPFHTLRCFLSTVTAIRHLQADLRIYNEAGFAFSWWKEATHSQNVVRGKRIDLIMGELRRIKRYQHKSVFLRLLTDGVLFLKAAFRDGSLFQKLRNIRRYEKQGSPVPLCSTEDALAYLEWRDTTK